MANGRRVLEDWRSGDELTAVRLQMMQDLAAAAQLTAAGPNVRVYQSALGGTALAVDETPFQPPRGGIIVVDLEEDGGDGTVATPYTYTAYREDSEDPLSEELEPLWRPVPANMESPGATKGLGDFGGIDGAFRLIVAFETPVTQAACEAA